MLKKILGGVVVAAFLCGVGLTGYWFMHKDQLQAEYAAYRKTGAPILMYHAICSREGKESWPESLILNPQLFEEHMKYLKEQGYQIISVEDLAKRLTEGANVEKCVALTFDDGYLDNYTIAMPIMKKYDAKGTFFVINQDINKPDKMGDKEIFGLLAEGMELGSHTTSHAPLAKIDPKFLAWELSTSRFYLKKNYNNHSYF